MVSVGEVLPLAAVGAAGLVEGLHLPSGDHLVASAAEHEGRDAAEGRDALLAVPGVLDQEVPDLMGSVPMRGGVKGDEGVRASLSLPRATNHHHFCGTTIARALQSPSFLLILIPLLSFAYSMRGRLRQEYCSLAAVSSPFPFRRGA